MNYRFDWKLLKTGTKQIFKVAESAKFIRGREGGYTERFRSHCITNIE